jgi:hypothetical protein
MYFNIVPNIEYDKKPVSFPFSNTQYVLAKNFFNKVIMPNTSYAHSAYSTTYTILDGERLDTISQKFYGVPDYDWVIAIVNNVINPYFDLPIEDNMLYSYVSSKYDSPEGIHHYETISIYNSLGEPIFPAGMKVDKNFYNTTHTFADRYAEGTGTRTFNGNQISFPVTNYQYEQVINDSKRNIYILNTQYLGNFVSQATALLEYSPSNSYINNTTKISGI